MVLATNAEILNKAMKGKYAVGAFNANNMEMILAIVETAEEENSPVIIQASQGAIKYAGLDMIVSMVRPLATKSKVPISLHLDHGTDFAQNVQCLRAGFTSLMFDGSSLPFDKNVEITKKICEIAHPVGVSVEAELGKIAGTEDNISVSQVEALMTDPEEAKKFVEMTKVDNLAVAVGSVHRMLTRTATLDIKRIEAIRDKVNIPLVLHGASGVSDEAVKEGVKAGICKINIATELNKRFTQGFAQALKDNPNEVDPRKFLKVAKSGVKDAVREKMKLFGCSGKA